ncbi:MAG: hypothetical protein K0S27_185 [Gammaproteobacteria bacterium]|jgi:hypothetical protein|nr:hypothetical protein [Gammaproteobacteria bacterium]
MFYPYDLLKLFHLIIAALILSSLTYSSWIWLKSGQAALKRISTQTWAVILPFSLIQLITGFTLVSLKQAELPEYWIKTCILSFIVATISWCSFIYFLLFSSPSTFVKKIQYILLILCNSSLLIMIFFMSNKPSGLHI